jgi:nicotinate-nucleotide adenylyltransferase
MTKLKQIGIFAGTFDPIHKGHIAFAQAALDAGLEKVMFLVEPRPRRKQGVRALEHRIAMVQLAIQDHESMGSIILEQARFTPHETLPVLQNRFKGYQLVLLFGDDVITHIAHWPHIRELVNSVGLMIAARHGDEANLALTFQTIEATQNLTFNYQFIDPKCPDIASSNIRLQLKKRQQPAEIPEAVWRYIRSHRLYASAATSSK